MDDSDDYGDFDDDEILAVASRVERDAAALFAPSPRPQKRRRVGQFQHHVIETPQQLPVRNRGRISQRGPFEDDSSEVDENASPTAVNETTRPYFPKTLNGTRKDQNALFTGVHCEEDAQHGHSLARPTERGGPTATGFTHRARNARAQSPPDHDTNATSRGCTAQGKRPDSRGTGGSEYESPPKQQQQRGNGKKDRIHFPAHVDDAEDLYLTQLPQVPSPPGNMRGAIWRKPSNQATATIGVHRQNAPSLLKQTALNLPKLPATPVGGAQHPPKKSIATAPLPAVITGALDYDIAQELADLPSDAFSSSPVSPQKIEDDDPILLSERRIRLVAPQTGLRQTTLFGRGAVEEIPQSQVNKRYNFVASPKDEPPTHHQLDLEAMKTWVYPTNLGTIRDYQFNIVARGLFHNLLVALPTGLGKTFIAATIMLNWFRWTKDAQIVFVAPTKPLVTQQVGACFNIAGIPRSQTSLLVGDTKPALRALEWKEKRVFFMTPQTISNDLKTGICDPKRIVLLVVDEAHKATGAYAYVEIVKFIRRFNDSFRVLALTATPGSDVESVQAVIDGLDISRIEIRTEQSLDIRGYVHHRKVIKKVFENSDEMQMCMDLYSAAVRPILSKLTAHNAFWSNDPMTLTPFGCTKIRQQWLADAGKNANQGVKFMVMTILTVLGSLSQATDLLKYHGIRPFYNKLREFQRETGQGKSKYKKEIVDSEHFVKMMNRLAAWTAKDDFTGHPKLDYLQEAMLEHFSNAAEGNVPGGEPAAETRVMIFAHFRDSAEMIVNLLKRHDPIIRPQIFVGQAATKSSKGYTQKEQLEVLEKFKKGDYNTLVATSIGEEGLDIGEVDLIVCYDSKASPLRMLQRMGRTGRKREGKVILLQSKGKEEQDFLKAKDSYEHIQELIANGAEFHFHEDKSRRIVPRSIEPVVDKRAVDIPLENSQQGLPEPKARGRIPKRPPKKFHMPDNVITGFVSAARMDEELAPKKRGRKPKAPLVYPSEEIAELQPLESVLLNEREARDLERRYQTVVDDNDDLTWQNLDLCKDPDRQLVLTRTKCFDQPGQKTRSFVKMLHRMRDIRDMEYEELALRQQTVHYSDLEDYPDPNILVSNASRPPSDSESGSSLDLPPLQLLPRTAPKANLRTHSTPNARPHAKPGPKPKPKPQPLQAPTKYTKRSPIKETYRLSDLVSEGESSSSPPPTSPAMRILLSQAESLGSQDTVRSVRLEDSTQAYRLDSDLRSFITDGEEEGEDELGMSSSSPRESGGLGKGTQAVVQMGRERERGRKNVEQFFTSDMVEGSGDEEEVVTVSSDSEEEFDLGRGGKRKVRVINSDDEQEEDEDPVPLTKRVRRIVEDSDEEDTGE